MMDKNFAKTRQKFLARKSKYAVPATTTAPSGGARLPWKHMWYSRESPRNQPAMTAARAAINKGYDILYNIGSIWDTNGWTDYNNAVEFCNEIGPVVQHIIKINLFPSYESNVPSWFDQNSIYSGTEMQMLVDGLPDVALPFTKLAVDLEPSSCLLHTGCETSTPSAYHFWTAGSGDSGNGYTAAQMKAAMQAADWTCVCDFILPYAGTTVFTGGLATHCTGIWIDERTYYAAGSTTTLVDNTIVGIAMNDEGTPVSEGTPYVASQFNSKFRGAWKMIFPVGSSSDWIDCANGLPSLR